VIEKIRLKNSSKKIKKINADRYEFMLYLLIEKGISNGTITIADSLSYKSLNDELIQDDDWNKHKSKLVEKLGNKLLQTDIDTILKQFEKELGSK
jgi:hypothetical protein